jgi:3'-phosphoadenosine 5'-phosphosulfate (PAPS) 3'-phosphatase
LDPIDGTKGFMTNKFYIVGLALVVDGEPVVN